MPKMRNGLIKRWLDKLPINLQIAAVFGQNNKVLQAVGLGANDFDVDPQQLFEIARKQLDLEIRTGKYIPDVFVEVHNSKNLARLFTSPKLFFNRLLDDLERMDFVARNKFLADAGMPPLPFPDLDRYRTEIDPNDPSEHVDPLIEELRSVMREVEVYKDFDISGEPPHPIADGKEHIYEERKYILHNIYYGVTHDLEQKCDELSSIKARVFILTGKAGQGKTNFVCDLVEKFLLRNQIPCAYFTGRTISVRNASDLGDSIKQLIVGDQAGSFDRLLSAISTIAAKEGKVFTLIVDAINEHNDVNKFKHQLEDVIERSIKLPNIRVMLTCRSEFFDSRFGNLTASSFGGLSFFHESDRTRLSERQQDLILDGYFRHFELKEDLISRNIFDVLKVDILLLRIFFEAYGARGRPSDYRQPEIRNIIREEIFQIYLEQRLDSASRALEEAVDDIGFGNAKRDLEGVFRHIFKYMVDNKRFGDVPISSFPEKLEAALNVLLNEDLILRRDGPQGRRLFTASDETVNFTFDEFRDFLLANYLYEDVFKFDHSAFFTVIKNIVPESNQSVEGLKRYLFYASRSRADDEFYEKYREEPWYEDVYFREIFSVNPDLHRDDDRLKIQESLAKSDYLSRRLMKRLIVRWDTSANPVLNLNLLLDYLRGLDNDAYLSSVLAVFSHKPFSDGVFDVNALCASLRNNFLPDLTPDNFERFEPLFLLVAWMLPVDTSPNLESEATRLFEELIEVQPSFAAKILHKSIDTGFDVCRPYVWRLCALLAPHIEATHDLRVEAQGDAQLGGVVAREAARFLRIPT